MSELPCSGSEKIADPEVEQETVVCAEVGAKIAAVLVPDSVELVMESEPAVPAVAPLPTRINPVDGAERLAMPLNCT